MRNAHFIGATAAAAFVLAGGVADNAQADDTNIDCAILLCLAGGWPAVTGCTAAHAEFISRITPFPIEPPVQIWNCPLGAAYKPTDLGKLMPRLYDAAERERTSTPFAAVTPTVLTGEFRSTGSISPATLLHLVGNYSTDNGTADVDISSSAYDFVRSIRVYSVETAYQHKTGSDGDCRRSSSVQLGTYGTQGDFSWKSSSVDALPAAYEGVSGWGSDCPSIYSRAVFIDWTDYQGNYGHEQVDY